jgi:predicted RNase H-like HicB family nuclease
MRRSGNGIVGKKFKATDGKLVLELECAAEGGYVVTAPFEKGLITEAESIEEAFEMAYDALRELRAARRDLARKSKARKLVAA